MFSRLDACKEACKAECRFLSRDNAVYRYDVVDVDDCSFKVVPLTDSSFLNWEGFTAIAFGFHCPSYFCVEGDSEIGFKCVLRVFNLYNL